MTAAVNRRQALTTIGTIGAGALLAACGAGDDNAAESTSASSGSSTTAGGGTTTPSSTVGSGVFDGAASCTLTPELTEGPYYFDVDSIRRDIREDRQGVTLRLAIRVRDATACTPLPDAVVDVWHCDATGLYSGFEAASTGGPGDSGRTDAETYLRGAQVTNADGIVEFVTIYPGWYRGRTVHIHAKVHLDSSTVLTTQLFFDETVTERVYEQDPYAFDDGRDTFNDTDGIFDESLILTLTEQGDGYLGAISFDVAAPAS